MTDRPLCRYCGVRRVSTNTKLARRGTCASCNCEGRAVDVRESAEPTEEELDRTITEQMKCLPPWWDTDTRMMRERERLGCGAAGGRCRKCRRWPPPGGSLTRCGFCPDCRRTPGRPRTRET